MATKRNVICPCGGDYYEEEYYDADWNEASEWSCCNCGARTKRTTRNYRKGASQAEPNRAQQKSIDWLRRYMLEWHAHGADYYEEKHFEQYPLGDTGLRSVVVVVGMKNDTGKMSEIFCRYTVHAFVGPRGQVHATKHKGRRGKVYGVRRVVIDCSYNCG